MQQAINNMLPRRIVSAPSMLEVAAQEPESCDATARTCACQRVSPPEDYCALLLGMDKDLQKALGDSDKEVPRIYQRVCLDARCKCGLSRNRLCVWWHARNMRECIGHEYRMVYQTSCQRAHVRSR